VEYWECKNVTVCASTSVARRRLVETDNPSGCATVDFNRVNKRQHSIACVCKCNYE
jgi:hypothetical protein